MEPRGTDEQALLAEVQRFEPLSEGDESRAGADLGRALAQSLLNLGAYYVDASRWEEAVAVLRRAEPVVLRFLATSEADLWIDLGLSETGAGYVESARGRLQRVRRLARRIDVDKERVEALVSALADASRASKTPPPPAAPPPTPTERYRHAVFGGGGLLDRNGDKLRVRFDDGTVRTLLASHLTREP